MPEDNECQRLIMRTYRPQVASRSGDLVELNDNDVSVSNSYEDELYADSVVS